MTMKMTYIFDHTERKLHPALMLREGMGDIRAGQQFHHVDFDHPEHNLFIDADTNKTCDGRYELIYFTSFAAKRRYELHKKRLVEMDDAELKVACQELLVGPMTKPPTNEGE